MRRRDQTGRCHGAPIVGAGRGGAGAGFCLLVLASLAAGCAPGEGELGALWAFADGRDCQTSGARTAEVTARRDGFVAITAEFPCAAGEETAVVISPLDEGFYSVNIEARSAEGAVLYTGDRIVGIVEGELSVADVALDFRGGGP